MATDIWLDAGEEFAARRPPCAQLQAQNCPHLESLPGDGKGSEDDTLRWIGLHCTGCPIYRPTLPDPGGEA